MSFFSWLRTPKTARRDRHHRFRPVIEGLEDRCVPAVLNVTMTLDVIDPNDGLLSLREAVLQANASAGADTIKLPAGDYSLSLGELDIRDDLTVIGAGPGGAGNAEPTVIVPQDERRVFKVFSANATLSGMHLRSADVAQGVAQGGVIHAVASRLALDNTLLVGFAIAVDHTTVQGGTLYAQGGAIYAIDSSVTIANSRVVGEAIVRSSSILTQGVAAGGAVYAERGSLKVLNSRFESSRALSTAFGEAFGGAIFASNAIVRISNSAFIVNAAEAHQGGEFGGAIYASGGTIKITNSRFLGNIAFFVFPANSQSLGGGLYIATGAAEIVGCTFVANSAGLGGGIFNSYGTLTVRHSTILGNAAQIGDDVYNAGLLCVYDSVIGDLYDE